MSIISTRRHRHVHGLFVVVVLMLVLVGSASGGALDVSWIAPTTNTDGSPLMDLAAYRVYYGTSSTPCPTGAKIQLASPTPTPPANQALATTLTDLMAGTRYYVSTTAVDANGNESPCVTPVSAVAHMDFAVSPTGTTSFGTVAVGSSTDRVFTVQNTEGGTVSGSASTASSDFSVVSGSPFTLAGMGTSQAITVRFRPTSAATTTANITVAATDGSSLSRAVTGTGTATGTGGGGTGGGGTTPDTSAPTVTITTPTTYRSYATRTPTVTVSGTASDNVGVAQVTWTNSRGGSGTATGTTSWSVSNIALQKGPNVITITARDAAGNTTTATCTIKRQN